MLERDIAGDFATDVPPAPGGRQPPPADKPDMTIASLDSHRRPEVASHLLKSTAQPS